MPFDLSEAAAILKIGAEGAAFLFLLLAFLLMRSTINDPPKPDPSGNRLKAMLSAVKWFLGFSFLFLALSLASRFFFGPLEAQLVMRPLPLDLVEKVQLPRVVANSKTVQFTPDGTATIEVTKGATFFFEASPMERDFNKILQACRRRESKTQVALADSLNESPTE